MIIQINRQKSSLAEELLNARKEIERQSDTIVRIAKEKEELTRDKAELTVQVILVLFKYLCQILDNIIF